MPSEILTMAIDKLVEQIAQAGNKRESSQSCLTIGFWIASAMAIGVGVVIAIVVLAR